MKLLLLIVLVGWFAVPGTFPYWDRNPFASHLPKDDKENIPIIPDVPRDAIPPLDFPRYESPQEAGWLRDDDFVLGIEFNNDARAYPLKILNWHEIVNEKVGRRTPSSKPIVPSESPRRRSRLSSWTPSRV